MIQYRKTQSILYIDFSTIFPKRLAKAYSLACLPLKARARLARAFRRTHAKGSLGSQLRLTDSYNTVSTTWCCLLCFVFKLANRTLDLITCIVKNLLFCALRGSTVTKWPLSPCCWASKKYLQGWFTQKNFRNSHKFVLSDCFPTFLKPVSLYNPHFAFFPLAL